MKFLAFILLAIALILEASLTTIPLVFLILLCLLVLLRQNWIFIFGFISGLVLDLVGFKTPGLSSAFFVTFLFLVLLYQSKFEIATNAFIIFASFLGSLGYLMLVGYNNNLIFQTILSSIIGLMLFKLMQRFTRTLQ